MKLTCILFFLSVSLVFASGSYAQNTFLSLKMSDRTVAEVLETIEEKTDFHFFYNSKLVNTNRRVSVNVKNKDVFAILNQMFEGQNVAYKVVDKDVILTANQTSGVNQRKVTITATVTDEQGEPIIGANLIVKGTTLGNITDLDGRVVLNDVPADAVLVVSYIGYITQEIPVGNQTNIQIRLVEDAQTLDEVVVVGYGTLEKKQVTNAVTSISADKLMVGVGGADVSSALQGRVSGLVMYNLGSPNSETTFQLRGISSINAGKAPLIVIDGFPGGDIRSLNQDDIKSIDILKDASAGAIYGTRATSGVILVTTKSGSNTNGKVKLNYSTEFGHKQSYNAPEMLTGREYAAHKIGTDYGHDTDWWDALNNNDNFSQKHHVSLDVGMEKAQVYTSFFYEDNEGISLKDSREDFGGRFKANFKLFDDWLEICPNVSYRQAARTNAFPDYQQALRNNPSRSPYDPESETGYNVWTNESLDYNVLADAMLTDHSGLDKWFKPEVTFKLNIKEVSGLFLEQVVGYENRQWEEHRYIPSTHRDEIENSRKGTAFLKFDKTEALTSQGYATYIREFDGKHMLNVVGGYDYSEKNKEFFEMKNFNFSVDGIKYWDIGKGSYLSDGKAEMKSEKKVTERLFALFARANYSYEDKYLFQASIRREGSSKFAEDNRWGNFWSLSGGWRISNENFMRDISWIDDLKARAAYGVVGNNDFDATYMANLLGSDENWMLPNGQWAYSFGKSQNVNRNLGWEETKEWDFGVDYSLFNGRLYGKFDYYVKTTDNMLFEVRVSQPPYPQEKQWQNIGSMEARGWEFEVGGDIIRNKEFLWSSNLNMSHETGKIKTMFGDNTYVDGDGFPAPGSPGTNARIQEGAKFGAFYIWKFADFDDEGGFLLYNKEGKIIPAAQKTENDKQYIGNYKPNLMIGWNHTLVYKNWDMGINLRSWIDFDVYNTINMYYGIQGQGNTNVLKDAYGKFNHIRGEKQICDYYLEDGTFLKIDAVTLGYTLPMKKYTKFIDRLRIYGTIGNLCTFSGYSGLNPEIDITGWKGGTERFWEHESKKTIYPVVRTYTLGLKVNF